MNNLMKTEKMNSELVTISGNKTSTKISLLFEEVKQFYKNAKDNGDIEHSSEKEVLRIQSEFCEYGDNKGVLFCLKALAIIKETQGDTATEETEKVKFYESAHESINDAIMLAEKIKWNQPSILKHQAIIKTKLGDLLHKVDDHYNANILESDAFKIFERMLYENPDYAEGHLEMANASYNKLKWTLRKMLFVLSKAENLFNYPVHRKHIPETNELVKYRSRIAEIRNAANRLIDVYG